MYLLLGCVILANSKQQQLLFSDIERFFSYIPVPVTFSVKINELSTGDWQFPVRYNQGYNEIVVLGENQLSIKKIPFFIDAKFYVPVLVGPKEKDHLIVEDDICFDWKGVKEYNQYIIVNKKELLEKELKFYKKKNDILFRYDIKEPDIIKKQDKCQINAKIGKVVVSMPGVALKNGSLGSTIKVLNEKTGKVLDAKVVNSKNVEVIVN